MPKISVIKTVLNEYGVDWAMNRALYSMKLKVMRTAPFIERCYEKKADYPKRLDLFQIDIKALKDFLRNILSKEDKVQVINAADKACSGIITGFSSVELNYGNPVDWQLNPLTGRRSDEKKKWYTIPDFDEKRGDIKVIWEASRFSHFFTLTRAYLLTENDKYYKAFSIQLENWLAHNPYGFGANFKCGQECSLRMVNALLAFTIFKECGIATDIDADNVKELIDRCYRKVLSNFNYAYKCIKNNHTISELMGMIVGAWCSNDKKQLNKAYDMLDEVIDEQFMADGGYRQFSFNYQRLAMQDLECVMSISKTTGRRLSEHSIEKLRNSAILMFQCLDDSGDMPNYGSNDGALIFQVSSCSYRDFRAVINTTYALTTGRQLFDKGKYQEELIWFSGGKDYQAYVTENIPKKSSRFKNAGLFTIRGKNSWAMIISNDYHSRPAHMDQLHFDLWIDGVNVLCDAGTYSYASEKGKKLVRNESHNTAEISGKSQMNTNGPFMLYNWTKRELGCCDKDIFESRCISANGYTHVRKVERIGLLYKITDNVNMVYHILFHTPCEIQCDGDTLVLYSNGQAKCRIRSSGSVKVMKSNRSLYYLKMEEINCVLITGHAGEETITMISEGENETWLT